MPDLFPGLLVSHDDVPWGPLSSASAATVALLQNLLLEESSTDLFVKHPDNRFDNVGLVFPRGRIDISLKIHFDRNAEAPVSDMVVGTAVAPANDIIWSGFREDVAVVAIVLLAVRKANKSWLIVMAGDRIEVGCVEATIIHNKRVRNCMERTVYNIGG